jgi:hypothetical protein
MAKNSLYSMPSNRSAVVDITVPMKSSQCPGAFTPGEILRLETEQEMRLHTCALCGKRNLYAVKDALGMWALEAHNKPLPRKTSAHSARKTTRRVDV